MELLSQKIASIDHKVSQKEIVLKKINDLSHDNKMLTIKQASQRMSQLLDQNITPSNISYLISYGLIDKIKQQKLTLVRADQLAAYYHQKNKSHSNPLSFAQYKESETTKHVHRLHPYKGKFIPQLVEYFLDEHTDSIKREHAFHPDDLVLDPFCGSGTTLVAANEVGLNAIGLDISEFNTFIANLKLANVSFSQLQQSAEQVSQAIEYSNPIAFEAELSNLMSSVNKKHFPSPQFRKQIFDKSFQDSAYGNKYLELILPRFNALMEKHHIPPYAPASNSFLDTWYLPSVRNQIHLALKEISQIPKTDVKNMLQLILSRTMRSCRATSHRALATLTNPVTKPYYCRKHGKLCHPLFSINRWWNRYVGDTIKRLKQFSHIRTNTIQMCFVGDSRHINLEHCLTNSGLSSKPIKGIFSSPPYVGMIDYHQQHAYSYEIFKFPRRDEHEIGPLSDGRSRQAQEKYVAGIADVLQNCKQFMIKDHHVFLVANDSYNLYPSIAKRAQMYIVNQYERPVLNRAEGDKSAYNETIFHLKSL